MVEEDVEEGVSVGVMVLDCVDEKEMVTEEVLVDVRDDVLVSVFVTVLVGVCVEVLVGV